MLESSSAPITSLYIHVPFCAHKCEYCAFFSEASSGELINRYIAALVRELEIVAGDLKPKTIFFGGGTPSILNLRQWETILRAMEKLNLLDAHSAGTTCWSSEAARQRGPTEFEFTVESNPATVSADKAKLLRDFGVNRVSMGVQSLDEQLLERLGRIHSLQQVFKSFDILRSAGFDNLNLDLMFAIPTQTMDIWRGTLNEAMAMQSEHLSSYEVIYEDDTPLFEQLKAGQFAVDEELACAMYEELISCATAAGFRQYEIANFARNKSFKLQASSVDPGEMHSDLECGDMSPLSHGATCRADPKRGHVHALHIQHSDGAALLETENLKLETFACQHNVNYWRGGSFYGLGPSATGYVRGVRTKNWSNTQLYCEQLERGKRAIESSEELSPLRRAGEIAAFGLRMNIGWNFDEFWRRTNFDLRTGWNSEMQQLAERGWAEMSGDCFRLTRHGLRFADAAAEMFLR